MGLVVQVVVDCAAPHPLAAWWAQTLGWEVEVGDEDFIRRMVDEGQATPEETTTYEGRLVWKVGAAITNPAGPPGTPRILFQLVPEAKTVKNRLHLDVRVTGDLESERAALEARGATFLHTGQEGPSSWVTMADPEGNEFCIAL